MAGQVEARGQRKTTGESTSMKAGKGQLAAQKAGLVEQLWRDAPHRYHGLRALLVYAGGVEDCQIEHFPLKDGFALLAGLGNQVAGAVSSDRLAIRRAAAAQIASRLNPGMLFTAESRLAGEVVRALQDCAQTRTADLLYQDLYFMCRLPAKKCQSASDPRILQASAMPPQLAAAAMAECWTPPYVLTTRSAREFEALLAHSDALLWLDGSRARAVQIFTELGRGQILLGQACGEPSLLPKLFSRLAGRTEGSLCACVDARNTQQHEAYRQRGLALVPNLEFSTLLIG